MYLVNFFWKGNWLTAPLMVGVSFHGWFFFLWAFLMKYKVLRSNCYIFSSIFLFHWFNQLVANFTFTSETYVTLLLLIFFPSKAAEQLFVKNLELKVEWAFFDGIRGDAQLTHFILLSVPISQQLPNLTSLYFFGFLEWPLKLDCTFCWQLSGVFEQSTSPESRRIVSDK